MASTSSFWRVDDLLQARDQIGPSGLLYLEGFSELALAQTGLLFLRAGGFDFALERSLPLLDRQPFALILHFGKVNLEGTQLLHEISRVPGRAIELSTRRI